MKAAQLKNAILQLAVQGKLVPQDLNDEPASVLLERIRKEKTKLIKAGKIKKDKNESVIKRREIEGATRFVERFADGKEKDITEELPFEVPKDWEWARLGSLIQLTSGQDMPPENYTTDKRGVPYITGASNIENGTVIINRWTTNPKAIAMQNDLLITCKGTVGAMAFLQCEGAHIARQIMSIRPVISASREYLRFFLESYVFTLKSAAKSMIPGIARADVLTALFPLPPLAEQHRIVAKIEELLPFVEQYDKADQALTALNETFPDQIKKSLLQAAVQGKLVPQDLNDEPASVLLERIRKEKTKLIKAGKIKKDKDEKAGFATSDKSHYGELPQGWAWSRLVDLYNFIDYRGVTPTKTSYGIPLVTAKNVKYGYIDYSIAEFISRESYEERQGRGISRKGDILFTTEAPLGNVAIADLEEFSAGQRLITFQKYSESSHISNSLFVFFLLSSYFQQELNKRRTGTTVAGIKAEKLKEILLPVPPLAEQRRIVAAIEATFEQLDNIVATLE